MILLASYFLAGLGAGIVAGSLMERYLVHRKRLRLIRKFQRALRQREQDQAIPDNIVEMRK